MCRATLNLGRCSDCHNVDLWMSSSELCIGMEGKGPGMVCRNLELRQDEPLSFLDQLPVGNCRVCQVLKNGKAGYGNGTPRPMAPGVIEPMLEYYVLNRQIPHSIPSPGPRGTGSAPYETPGSFGRARPSPRTDRFRQGFDDDSDFEASMRRPRVPSAPGGAHGRSPHHDRRQREHSPVPTGRDRRQREHSPGPLGRDRRQREHSPGPMGRDQRRSPPGNYGPQSRRESSFPSAGGVSGHPSASPSRSGFRWVGAGHREATVRASGSGRSGRSRGPAEDFISPSWW